MNTISGSKDLFVLPGLDGLNFFDSYIYVDLDKNFLVQDNV